MYSEFGTHLSDALAPSHVETCQGSAPDESYVFFGTVVVMDVLTTTRSIEDVAASLRRGKERGQPATLLIGAGCSASAGIPLASGFIEELKTRFPREYARAEPRTYANCMMQLAPDERRELIAHFTMQAKVNWAHICIAQLIAEGYFGWILTANFDSLLQRGCSLIDAFPPIYDLALLPRANQVAFPPVAVFHLHGQHTSHYMANTPDELREQRIRVEPLLRNALIGKSMLVVGYSGENDPLFEALADVPQFTCNLYWAAREGKVGFHVAERLLAEKRYAFSVPIIDADRFFIDLATMIGVFPPAALRKPFHFFRDMLGQYPAIPQQLHEGEVDVLEHVKRRAADAAANEEAVEFNESRAREAFARKEYLEIISIFKGTAIPTDALKTTSANAYSALARDTLFKDGDLRAELKVRDFEMVIHYCQEGANLKNNGVSLWNAWGAALKCLAETETGDKARQLLLEALDKFDRGLQVSNGHWLHNNKGGVLYSLAMLDDEGSEARRKSLIASIGEYATALSLKSDYLLSLNNRPIALQELSLMESNEAAILLLDEACEHLENSTRIQVKNAVPWRRWVECLLAKADRIQDPEARTNVLQSALKAIDRAFENHAGDSDLLKFKETAALKLSGLSVRTRAANEATAT